MADNPQETHVQDEEEDKNSSSDDDSSSSSSGSGSSSSSSSSDSESEDEAEGANATSSETKHAAAHGGASRTGHAFPNNNAGPALSAPRPHGMAANTETLNVNSTRAAARFKAAETEGMMPLGTRKRDRRTIEEIQRDLRDKRKKPLGNPAARSSPPPPRGSPVRSPEAEAVVNSGAPMAVGGPLGQFSAAGRLSIKRKPVSAHDRLAMKLNGRKTTSAKPKKTATSNTGTAAVPPVAVMTNKSVTKPMTATSLVTTGNSSSSDHGGDAGGDGYSSSASKASSPVMDGKVVRALLRAMLRYGDLTDVDLFQTAANFADEYKMPSFIERSNLPATTRMANDSLLNLAAEVAQKAKQAVEARPPHDSIKIGEVEARSSQIIERLYENLKLRVAVQQALRTAGCSSGNAQVNAQGAYVLVAKQSDLAVLGVNTRDLPNWTWAEKEHDWTPRKDAALLLGVYVHGFGGWEDILNDDLLHFQGQRALKGERLKKRAENLLKRLPAPDLDAGEPRIVQLASSLSSAGGNSNQSLGAQFSAIIHSGVISGVTASIPAVPATGSGRMQRAAERFAVRQQNGEDPMGRRHAGLGNGSSTLNGDSGRQHKTPVTRSPAQANVADHEPEDGEVGGISPAQSTSSRHKRRSSSVEDEDRTLSRKKHRNNSSEISTKTEKRKKEHRRSTREKKNDSETPAMAANTVAEVAAPPLLSTDECYEKWQPNKELREIRQVLKKMKIMADWSRNQKDETVVEKVFKYLGSRHSHHRASNVSTTMFVRMATLSSRLPPPPTAEELALKEQVTQVLTSQGVLAKLKAELRAAVFEVMHEREGFTKRIDPAAPKLSDFPIETRTTALALIVECLQFFHWNHALRVLLAETDAEDEQHDSARLATKLRLASSSETPTLFQLIESRVIGGDQTADSTGSVPTPKQFDVEDDEEETQAVNIPAPKTKPWEPEEAVHPLPSKEFETTETEAADDEGENEVKNGTDDDKGESSAEIEESMMEEVPSGSELEESNFTNFDDDEESHGRSGTDTKQPTTRYPSQESHSDANYQDESECVDVKLAPPPPAPAKLPALPPLVSTPNNTRVEDAEDNFDAEEEAERLRNLDAALQAMEADDDTGTLQQLKASLQVELQEQDSFGSSGGRLGRPDDEEDTEAEISKARDTEEEEGGYGSSDFEEEEEIASEISEEMESMSELSDKESDSVDGAAVLAAEVEPPRALRNDTRVDSENALNSYDYIEDVEKGRW
ncbi:hypothetical protein PRIC1_009306 [Phytophthora ramorum]